MADTQKNREEGQEGLPAWLWMLIWTTLGIVGAILVITILILPLIWLFSSFSTPLSPAAATAAAISRVRATQTGMAQAGSGEGNTSQVSAELTGTAQAESGQREQTPVAGEGTTAASQSQAAQTTTAQAQTGSTGDEQTGGAQTDGTSTGGTPTAEAEAVGSVTGDGQSNGGDGSTSTSAGTPGAGESASTTVVAPTVTPSATPPPTEIPSPTPTATATPTPVPQVVTNESDVNVYEGPGIVYPIIATLPADIPLPIIGRNEGGTWWQIEAPDGRVGWVPDLLVQATDTGNVSVVEAPPPPTPPAVPTPSTIGEDYIVQRDDWLSKLSDKFYDDVTAFWPIMAATNLANVDDLTYARIDDEDLIEIGQKLRIPSAEEALTFMEDFDPERDVARLFPPGDGGQLLVGTWWTAPGEFAALNQVYQRFLAENADVELVDAGVPGGEGQAFRAVNVERLAEGDPYDVFLVHPGFEIERYSQETLVSVAGVLTETEVLAALPEVLQTLLQVQDEAYVVPLNIHRGNVLWRNTRLLEQAGVAVPATLDELFAACDTLRNQGLVPLAMGTADGFELSHTFEVVLAATAGPEISSGLWTGAISWSNPAITQTLENFGRLLDCTNENRADLDWVDAIDMVLNDEAAFTIMGDWAYGELIFKDGLNVVSGGPVPGSEGQFLLVAHGFALAQNAPNPDNAAQFLTLLTRREVQEAFSQNKGALCARLDCDYSTFPADRQAYFQNTASDLSNDVVIPMATHGSAISPSWQDQLNQVITQFVVDRDVTTAQTSLIFAAADAGFPQ